MLNGDEFEARSARLLTEYGYRLIASQYRCKVGEIDLIAHDEHRLLFVEVRARRHSSYGGAAASVNRAKQCKLQKCAALFLSSNPQWRHLPCRFDVIAWEPIALTGEPTGLARERTGPVGKPAGADGMQARWIQAAFLA